MSSSEEYLDSLLRTLNGEQNKEESEPEVTMEEEPVAEETTPEATVVEESMPELKVEGDPNRAMSADEIAALFAQAQGTPVAEATIAEEAVVEENEPGEFFAHPKNERLKTFLSKVL